MRRFYTIKTLKSFLDSWKRYQHENIDTRKKRLKIRKALKRRPELA